MAGRNLLRSAIMMMKVLCVVDEKDFLQFGARAKIFFSFRAHASGSMRNLPGYPSETHVWKVNSRSKMQQAKHA
eukprot:scaffold6785_cov76-Skeletonema_dohrnii-CCMP3373.AAC.2